MVTRQVTVDWASKKIVRLQSPKARLWTLSLSTEREKCLHEAYSGYFTGGKLSSEVQGRAGTSLKRKEGQEHHTGEAGAPQ